MQVYAWIFSRKNRGKRLKWSESDYLPISDIHPLRSKSDLMNCSVYRQFNLSMYTVLWTRTCSIEKTDTDRIYLLGWIRVYEAKVVARVHNAEEFLIPYKVLLHHWWEMWNNLRSWSSSLSFVVFKFSATRSRNQFFVLNGRLHLMWWDVICLSYPR